MALGALFLSTLARADEVTALKLGIQPAIEAYVALAGQEYGLARDAAGSLRDRIDAFLAAPSSASLTSARNAWITSHEIYGRTEVFRFVGGPIDGIHPLTGVQGPEGRINAWPVDEAFLDYVEGSSTKGLIGDLSVPITAETLVGKNGAEDETQVTLGFHAIEFLLWGQDRDPQGPGNRPFSDYLVGDPIRERRRACIELMAKLLVDDLASVAKEWERNPRSSMSNRPWPAGTPWAEDMIRSPMRTLAEGLSGAASLAGFELASERIGIPLASGGQEDEESCFSDTTHRDLVANVDGIVLVLEGQNGAPGLLDVLDGARRLATGAPLEPEPVADLRSRLQRIQELVNGIQPPFDQILTTAVDDPRRIHLQVLEGELLGLAGALQRAGKQANLHVTIGTGG